MIFGAIVSSRYKIQNYIAAFEWPANASNMTNSSSQIVQQYIGVCSIDLESYNVYLKEFRIVYALVFALAVVLTLGIYVLIYYYIIKWKKKRKQLFCSYSEIHYRQTASKADTCCNSTASDVTESCQDAATQKDVQVSNGRKMDTGGINFHKIQYNIKLAIILFTVSIVFIISYLSAWLAALSIIEYDPVAFYMYFAFNVIHPITFTVLDKQIRHRINFLACAKRDRS